MATNYESLTKDDLLAQAKTRGIEVATASNKADIIAALQLADEEAISSPGPIPPLEPSLIPVVDEDKEAIPPDGEIPSDSEYNKGHYINGGETYALAIRKDIPNGKTHFAKNSRHFWQGTEEEFRAQFEKL